MPDVAGVGPLSLEPAERRVRQVQSGDRLTSKPALRFVPEQGRNLAGFCIDDSILYQRIDGFGASFLEAGAICLRSLPPASQEAVLRALFDSREGAGFSAMKTVIAATDFMSAGPHYIYDDVSGDLTLSHFSIARDLKPTGLIPYIKRACLYGSSVLQVPMDYPPDWMLWDVRKKQDVNPRYFAVLFHYYLRYLQEYAKHGIFIDYLSPFNEPGIYAKIGPLFACQRVKTRITVCDFANR